MNSNEAPIRVLLIDTNVYFVRRMTEALKKAGFEIIHHPTASYALTMLEWNTPDVILCATELREMGAFEMVPILRSDAKTAKIPFMALGNGGDQGLLQAYRAGCDDYIDRRGDVSAIVGKIESFLLSVRKGFQPTQMLSATETSLSGNIAHLDLPGVVQMLSQSGQTGGLHINAGETDAVIFFEAGVMHHAECGSLSGEKAVMQIIKNCQETRMGTYKFVVGTIPVERTVHRQSMDLLLDAMREYDEAQQELPEKEFT
jgi:CheY-like chemotaxis protein